MIIDRIMQLIDFKGINKSKFYKETGLSNGFLDKVKDIGASKIEDILKTYPEISPEWLLTGKGEMLKKEVVKVEEPSEKYLRHNKKGFPVIPIEAMAGFANGDGQVMEYDVIKGYQIPELEGKGVKYLIRVSGSSMYPKYSNGDLLACKPLKDRTFFQWGKPYVLDTEQGAIVKRLFPCREDDDCLECHSDNKEHYPPFKIPKNSIRTLAIVVGVIRLE